MTYVIVTKTYNITQLNYNITLNVKLGLYQIKMLFDFNITNIVSVSINNSFNICAFF